MTFYEVQLPDNIPYGIQGGPFYQTVVITAPSQVEQRYQLSSRAFRMWTLDEQALSLLDYSEFEEFYYMAQGKTHGFRFKDKKDYKAVTQPVSQYLLGGVHYGQLTKLYNQFGLSQETRPIKKPQTALTPITLQRDGVAFPTASNWTVDTVTGIVTFAADQTGHTITWSGQFDAPVRFDFDEMQVTWNDFADLMWGGLKLIELNI